MKAGSKIAAQVTANIQNMAKNEELKMLYNKAANRRKSGLKELKQAWRKQEAQMKIKMKL